MSEAIFVGLALMGVSAYHLIPALLYGEIPTTRTSKPLTRSAKPTEFDITFGVFATVGAVGVVTLLVATLHYILNSI